jgi:hypothetical protein
VLELWAVSCVLEGVFGTQDIGVPGPEFRGDRVTGLGSRREMTDSGLKGTRPAALKPARILFSIIEEWNASINASKKSSFVI